MKFIEVSEIALVPSWADVYLQYGDGSHLPESDKKAADDWLDDFLGPDTADYSLQWGGKDEFCPFPAFGLAGEVIELTVHMKKYDA